MPPVERVDDTQAGGPSRLRVILRSVLGVAAGVGVAAVVARYLLHVDPQEVVRSLAGVPFWALAASVASGFVMLGLQSLRWHLVMHPLLGLGYGQAYRAQVVGYMFNAVLPARGGDLLRVQYLGRRTGKSRATILGTEIVDRWLDVSGLVSTILVLAVVSELPRWIYVALAAFGALLTAWATTMVVLTRRGYVPRPGSRFGDVYGALRAGVEAFRSRRIVAIALGVAPLSWLWEAGVIHFVTPAYGIHLTFTEAFCVVVGFNAAMVVPSPGAIGTIEMGGAAAFDFFHADQSRALAYMFVHHFAQLVPGIMTGVAILVAEGEHLFGKAPSRPPSGGEP
jgi:uncharacterized membrane protein YbhN (UPF0104 family)